MKTHNSIDAMNWKAHCPINELPPRLRRLAQYRKNTTEPTDAGGLIQIAYPDTVNCFLWEKTPEGFYFWRNTALGFVSSNLEEVLTAFEREHPEICGESAK